MITREQLLVIMPHACARADRWLEPLNAAMDWTLVGVLDSIDVYY